MEDAADSGRDGAGCTPTFQGFLGMGTAVCPPSCVHKERNTMLGDFGTKDRAGVLGDGGGIRQGLL